MLLYLHQEGRKAGLATKLLAYMLHEQLGADSGEAYELLNVPVDQREYGHCVRFLQAHRITRIRIMTNSPEKIEPFVQAGITCIRVPLEVGINEFNQGYIDWKTRRGHMFSGR